MTEYHTQEIEAPVYLDDPKVLAYLEGTDADMGRLVLEDDGKLWAHSKRSPDDLCRSSLEDMVALAFPRYFAAVTPEPAQAPQVAPAIPVKPKTPRVPKSRRDPLAGLLPVPVRGHPQGMLASRVSGCSAPRVTVDGVSRIAPRPIKDGSDIKVSLRDTSGVMVGRAVLARVDYLKLVEDPAIRADGMLWTLSDDGEVTARVRGNPGAIVTRGVNELLQGLDFEGGRVRIEAVSVTN